MKIVLFTSIFSFALVSFIFGSSNERKEMVGKKAPNFTLLDDQGKERTLQEFAGKKIVLYFYPKDDTPGCTKEACSFRDNISLYSNNDIIVLGISYDSPESHKKFKEKYNLPFILLSDSEKKVAELYHANHGISGKFVANRVTYLIDEEGIIVDYFENVDVSTHALDVLKKFGIKSE